MTTTTTNGIWQRILDLVGERKFSPSELMQPLGLDRKTANSHCFGMFRKGKMKRIRTGFGRRGRVIEAIYKKV